MQSYMLKLKNATKTAMNNITSWTKERTELVTGCTASRPISSERTDSTFSIAFSSSSLKVNISILAMVSVLLCCSMPFMIILNILLISIAKGVDENGNEFEKTIHINQINPKSATVVEMRALEAHTGIKKLGGFTSLRSLPFQFR